MAEGYRGWFLEQLGMYAAYHRDRRNQLTHHVGVPLIVFSLLVALAQLPVFGSITAATVILGLLLIAYVVAVPIVGIITAIFYGILYGVAAALADSAPTAVWSVAISGFVGGWIIQFVGHAFEGRRPAFTTNLLQIFMAPPFLIAEILFGLGMEKDLESTLESRAVKYAPKAS